MKIHVYLLLAVLYQAGNVTAQNANFGIKGGLNVYTINNENDADYDSKAGFNLGLLSHIHLAKQWAIQPEIVYSLQGAMINTGNIETKINLGYINIPVLFQYMFDNGFRLQAGPQLGFLVNAKSKTGGLSVDIKDNLNIVDFGLGVGAGYVHTPSGFGVDARYNFGLSNINENSSDKSFNRGFQLGVFYLFKHL
jgi:Outer membrane protein beta-barrel domain